MELTHLANHNQLFFQTVKNVYAVLVPFFFFLHEWKYSKIWLKADYTEPC